MDLYYLDDDWISSSIWLTEETISVRFLTSDFACVVCSIVASSTRYVEIMEASIMLDLYYLNDDRVTRTTCNVNCLEKIVNYRNNVSVTSLKSDLFAFSVQSRLKVCTN